MSDSELQVTYKRTRFSTDYWATGTPEACKEWFERLRMRYHPCGYGTSGKQTRDNGDGTVVWHAYRQNSCD